MRNKGKSTLNKSKLAGKPIQKHPSNQANKILKLVCASCNSVIEEDYIYCMNCGVSLK